MPDTVAAPSCKLCGQPMYYVGTATGQFTFHTDTDEFICKEGDDGNQEAEA